MDMVNRDNQMLDELIVDGRETREYVDQINQQLGIQGTKIEEA